MDYDNKKLQIRDCPIKGVRVDRVHGKSYKVKPRFYFVKDGNLPVKGEWLFQIHPKKVVDRSGREYEATILSIFLAPRTATNKMINLTRQSITVQSAGMGSFKGRPYAHVTFRPLEGQGGKKTASRGQKDSLPAWFKSRYGRMLKLRRTVQGQVQSEHEVGRRLGKYHDTKQVVVFKSWDDHEFIRYFFLMRVLSAYEGFDFFDSDE
jgi:hypothetical protein